MAAKGRRTAQEVGGRVRRGPGVPGRRLFPAICTVVAAVLLQAAPAGVRAQRLGPKEVGASIRRVFGPGAQVDTVHVETTSVLRISRGDSLAGFAVVDDVMGKDQPITFLVAIGSHDRLKDVDILVYREPYGGEVAYAAWRRQFRGKSADDSLRVGREIRGISGATISVNAVTRGVARLLDDLTRWHRQGALR